MVRTRTGWLVAVAALGLGVGACKKNENKKADEAKTTDTASKDKGGGVATPSLPSVAAGDDLSLLPANSEMVLGLNFAQLQQSALWKQFAPKLMEKMESGLAEFKAACGFDPMEAIKSVSMGLSGVGKDQPDGAIVIHGLDKAKSMACLDKAKAEAAKKGTEITVDGDVFMMKDKGGSSTAWTFVNNDTMLGVVGPAATKDTLLAAAKGGSSLKNSQTFTEMYSKINTKESLWILVNGNAPFMAKAAQAGVKPKAVFGSVNVTDGLTVDLRIRLGSADEATQLVNMMKGQTQSPQVKQMFDKLDVTSDGADAKIAVAMSNAKLQQLIGMVGGMMGGMMGGAGGPGMGGTP
ncbi:MAG TPA: hypothetical protein VLB44_02590 [Kofleriaceae bacterium]|nr:hypothetical protein [Kofleriaceae bacterium]